MAAAAEDWKTQKYQCLPPGHTFLPIAIKTLGAIGPKSLTLVVELGCRIRVKLGEVKSTEDLLQRLSEAAGEQCIRA